MRARTEGVTWRKVDDQVVILDLEDSCYLRTNGVGALLWERLQEEATLDELVAVILSEFDVESEVARADVDQFVKDLKLNKLLLSAD